MAGYVTNPQAMHETIDGETIVIDLATGTYYSLRGSGPTIWNAVAAGASTETIIERLEAAVVEEAFLTDQVKRDAAERPRRCAVAGRTLARRLG